MKSQRALLGTSGQIHRCVTKLMLLWTAILIGGALAGCTINRLREPLAKPICCNGTGDCAVCNSYRNAHFKRGRAQPFLDGVGGIVGSPWKFDVSVDQLNNSPVVPTSTFRDAIESEPIEQADFQMIKVDEH